MKRPPADVGKFNEAAQWFRGRIVFTDKQWKALREESKQRASGVASMTHLKLVADVWAEAEKAAASGDSLEDFKRAVKKKLAAWEGSVEAPAARLEATFRNALQTAYNAGRYQQLTTPAMLAARPYWRYVAILDTRTTQICSRLDGKVIDARASWWGTHWPPLHHQCRSTVVALSRLEAQEEGISSTRPPVEAQEGFGRAPSAGLWKPDVEGYPHSLRKAFSEKHRDSR